MNANNPKYANRSEEINNHIMENCQRKIEFQNAQSLLNWSHNEAKQNMATSSVQYNE